MLSIFASITAARRLIVRNNQLTAGPRLPVYNITIVFLQGFCCSPFAPFPAIVELSFKLSFSNELALDHCRFGSLSQSFWIDSHVGPLVQALGFELSSFVAFG